MPAINMASAGGGTAQVNAATTKQVISCPFSGPTNSPFDAQKITGWSGGRPTKVNDATNYSTGALSTGIGFGIGPQGNIINPTAPQSIKDRGFTDDYTPGVTSPAGVTLITSILTAIGGGKSTAAVNGIAPTVPYNAQPLHAFGHGASRDAGAGPIFTGFGMKMVTATATVAEGAAIEAGFLNRSGRSVVVGESAFGSNNAASQAIA